MFYARKAALRLDRQRVSLQRHHKALLVDLTKNPGQTQSAEFSQRIEILRSELKQSMIESIEISRVVVKWMDKLNFGSMAEASIAQGCISKIHNDFIKTLNDFDTNAARQASK
ncbi:hypothetical protein ABIB00_007003 [Bradyrhizobium sp. LB14.3]|uniref:hypothetical protein n=1 Tax=Bradyrhizobium sp. LB14.3 TaxID=3156328 RepID=UPI003398D83A